MALCATVIASVRWAWSYRPELARREASTVAVSGGAVATAARKFERGDELDIVGTANSNVISPIRMASSLEASVCKPLHR